jgi:two-component system response regulator MtrA
VEKCETVGIKPTVLYVEDDERIRSVLTAALEDEGYEIVEAADGETGVQLVGSRAIELAVVDLRLPGMTGFDVVREIRRQSAIPIVILTAHGDSHDVVAGLEAGADDFLSKPIGAKELAARLRAILRRSTTAETPTQPSTVKVGSIEIRPSTHESFIDGTSFSLTRTEFDVLLDLASHSPETVTRTALLDRVWGYDYLGDSRLVDMQIYRIRQKLAIHGVDDRLQTVRGVGFKLVP